MPAENVATPPADAPATLTDAQIADQAIAQGMEAAEAIEGPAVVVEAAPEVPEVETPEAEAGEPKPEETEKPEEQGPPIEPEKPPVEEAPEIKPEDMTDEQRDEADAKALGFKNQKANTEFKAMRAELRELRPLQEKLADVEPMAERWSKVYQYCQTNDIDADAFAQGMAMTAGTRSKDPAIMAKTLEGLEWEADRLRKKLGVAGGKYDPLTEEGNRDLAQAVENEEMTPQLAQQQARMRAELAHRQGIEQQTRQQAEERQTTNQARQAAINELDAIGNEYAKLDPMYQAKSDLLVPMLQPIFSRLPPAEWAAAFRQAYSEFKLPAGPQTPIVPPAVPPLRNNPLRPTTPSSMQTREIKSEDDVFERALAAAAAIDGVPNRQPA